MLQDSQFLRYQRQISLPQIGEEGQQRLLGSHVLVIGCGGLGSAACLYLAAAGVGKLVVIDDDSVDLSNMQRQVVYRQSDVGTSKVKAMAEQLTELNRDVSVRTVDKRLESSQLGLEIMLADLVLDCSDNLSTRHLVNQLCYEKQTPLVSAAAIGWQGQFAVFDFAKQDKHQPSDLSCYRCLVPFDELPNSTKCSDSGVVGPVVGTLGNYQALAAIQKLAIGQFQFQTSQLHIFDGLSLKWQTMKIGKDKHCAVCASE
ncbi:HesA/MoeB/ThiF family protein [Vibrio sp. LaRot3]|uniref:HesA/MoeB/ThiF family protein n=1 Tax=Vibrio sp. LaRot3 TaxID=2998829 RepID=UPI0022CE27EA|nr:HesA/MoeB/ThiF family protein [Vibrio sp. LaRot3]MDA0150096.1 HesA/MoeB/ThiF family protein [Vibrio sp. LaRot3]